MEIVMGFGSVIAEIHCPAFCIALKEVVGFSKKKNEEVIGILNKIIIV